MARICKGEVMSLIDRLERQQESKTLVPFKILDLAGYHVEIWRSIKERHHMASTREKYVDQRG